jgi:hypothetical protein
VDQHEAVKQNIQDADFFPDVDEIPIRSDLPLRATALPVKEKKRYQRIEDRNIEI